MMQEEFYPVKVIDRQGKKYLRYSCGHLSYLGKERDALDLAQLLEDNYEIIECPECGEKKVKELENEIAMVYVIEVEE